MPSTSIVIPAFNREAYVAEAIESVLAQIGPGDEIIVIDDGSTDHTLEVVEHFPQVRCVSQANGGIAAARNAGIALAQGDLIAFLDSDDLWLPGKLDLQKRRLEEQGDLDLVFCHIVSFLSPEMTEDPPIRFDREIRPGLLPSCMLARRDAFSRVGLFDTTLEAGEFIAWFGRAEEAGLRHETLPDLLVKRRVHRGNSVHDRAGLYRGYLSVLKDQLARRRLGATS